jgi:hypothetical protein
LFSTAGEELNLGSVSDLATAASSRTKVAAAAGFISMRPIPVGNTAAILR